jgi:glycosyltransferase involved in cell wall biosynthesis
MANGVSQSGPGEKETVADCPLVSVITPLHNGIKYLEACTQSVLNQTYSHIEHVFVDGGSNDGSLDMLASYQARCPERISFISEPDRGVGEALNKGMKMARGQILGWLDSDDLYQSDAVMSAVEFFRSNSDAYYVFGGCDIINEAGEVIGKVPIKDFNFKKVVRGEHYISLSAAFYRCEVIEKVGPFNTIGNTFDYWIRVAQQFQMHRIEETLCSWRLYRDSIGFSKDTRKVDMIREKLLEDYILCRQYGGGLFATRCRKYFLYMILNRLGLFRFLNLNIRLRLRRYRVVDQALRMFGG